jgi:cytochrome c-type biogenesis protein CcmH/NrfG
MTSSARIDELRKKFDENPRRYFAPLANEYRKAGDFDQAIFICQEYLPQQPGHMSGHIVFGQALFEAKRLPEARTVFETALTLDPENLIALRHLADISRELGEITAARGWYERVLQADPRNEEIAAIMTAMSGSRAAAAVAAAPTADAPKAQPAAPPAKPPLAQAPASPTAPTVVEMSTAAVQEMVRARQAAKTVEEPASTLDEAPTIELIAPPPAATMEGLEPTSQAESTGASSGGMLDIPSGGLLDSAPDAGGTFDIPTGGMLGLETTAVAAPAPEVVSPPVDGFDTMSTAEFSALGKAPVAPPVAPPAADSGGLLDLDSVELGGGPTPPAVPATAAAPAAVAPIDGGSGTIDFDFELPGEPAAPAPPAGATIDSTPTAVMDAIKDVAPVVMDVVEEALPAVIDLAEKAVPAVVDAVTAVPTMIMDAIRVEPPKTEAPKAPAEPPAERAAPAFVTETMAQLYLEQGHRAEAIDIYRQLVAAKPNDTELRARLEAIERGPAPRAQEAQAPALDAQPTQIVASPTVASRRFNTSGPRIRDLLRDLFGIDGVPAQGNGAEHGSPDGERGSIDVLFSAAASDELIPLATAFDGGYVAPQGSIDEVFAGGGR